MKATLERLGIYCENSGAYAGEWFECSGRKIDSISPADGKVIAQVQTASKEEYEKVMKVSTEAFKKWRMVPAPQRGEIVRQIGEELRLHKKDLGKLISYEMGKMEKEGLGEVQEMIDIANFAVGLSRQLYGLSMHSERPTHRMYEQWHPLGVVGVITPFCFPVAVWAWNTMIAAVCGDVVVWKPSSLTPLSCIAVQNIMHKVLKANGHEGVMNCIIARGSEIGDLILNDKRMSLISFTGHTETGREVAQIVGRRFGKTILQLDGNNALIVMEDANMDMALRVITNAAIGTAAQKCTSMRRLVLQKSIAAKMTSSLINVYKQVAVGNPLEPSNLMGPLVDKEAVKTMQDALKTIKEQGGEILYGGEVMTGEKYGSGCYVKPALVKAPRDLPMMKKELCVPILYIVEADDLEDAIEINNSVDQGFSSAIFTNSFINVETFLSARGSDCGIANVNMSTSGAEISVAFGGEKDTGGGREAGTETWKFYMRRQTNTINWGTTLPLAQGVKFDING